ncbi:hypothetical protein AB4Y36_07585 [Paraburkholderia sp. BR10936]|uniref:hypothetical protein n=1 Tax=Paraburkholderia sp. BR10936 TaxID=3236993 RepID=UPI0034D38996
MTSSTANAIEPGAEGRPAALRSIDYIVLRLIQQGAGGYSQNTKIESAFDLNDLIDRRAPMTHCT